MVKKAASLKVKKKRNGKFYVTKNGGKVVNGADKVAFLVAQGKITLPKSKAKETAEPAG